MRRIRRHLTYSNVMVTILAFIVLTGGTAVALSGTNTVFTDDIANDTQPASGGNPAGGLQAADLRPGSVGSSEVANGTIAGADLAPSALPKGRATNSSCDPTLTSGYIDCGSVTINLTRSSRVLVIASGMWFGNGNVDGRCRIGVDGGPLGPDAAPGQFLDNSGVERQQNLTLTNVTGPLAPGNHTFGLACAEDDANIVFQNTHVSAVVLGPG